MSLQKKFELNWFTGLEVIAKSWFMTFEPWQVIQDSWRPCTLFFGSLWVTTKNFSSIGSMVEELLGNEFDRGWAELSQRSLSPKSLGNCLAGVILNSVKRCHQSAPTCWSGNTFLKGFHAQTGLGMWAHYYYTEYPRFFFF